MTTTSPVSATSRCCATPSLTRASSRSTTPAQPQRPPGVVAIVTQDDLDARGAPTRPPARTARVATLEWGVLAQGTVRFVGEPIVAVVAESRSSRDALELVEVVYDELPGVMGAVAALAPDAPLLYPEWGTNEFLHLAARSPGLDDALEHAPHVFTETFENHRIFALPLEGHGAQASFDGAFGRLQLIASSQQPHQLRTVVAEVCGLTEAAVRVVAPDMGGGFGNKQHFLREECLVSLLAMITGRSVRWSEDRTEALTASVHSRPQTHHVTVAHDDEGKVLALDVRVISDVGNPVLYFSGIGPSLVTVGALCGAYDIPEHGFELSCVATTTCPIGAYRGFGQPQAHFTTERVMDRIAQRTGIDPAEVRRRNLLPDAPRPFIAHGGARVDVGPLAPQLDQLLEEAGYSQWRERQAAARAEGRHVGIGLSSLVQGTSPTQWGVAGRFGSWETATVSVLPDGTVTVAVGTKSQGQGHETVFAQVAADALGIDRDQVVVREGDTDQVPYGMGTWGSRSAVMAGGAVLTAAGRVKEKMDRLGKEMHPDADHRAVAEEACWHTHRLVAGEEPGLTETAVYTPGGTIPVPNADGHTNFDETFGSHMTMIVVEVDPATGHVEVLDAVLVSDCGVMINPTLVEGQHVGGFAQGLGNVLHEEVRYSEEGQPLCATLLDYTPPLATDVPPLRIVHRETPSPTAGGFRGVGEATIISTPAAVAGAVEDALAPLGVAVTTTRLQPHHVRALVRATGWAPDPAAFAGFDGGRDSP
ncbi:MAG: xanthine dehydrogenase family protein molybdopterin-binding subunit [Acidimicrobiia bacterium]